MSISLVTEFEKIVKSFNTIVFGDDDQDVVVDGITKPTISKIMLGIKSQFNGLKLEMTNLLNSSRDESNIIVSDLRDLNDQGEAEIINLQNAIDIAAAAGAGANGWTALLVQDASGKTQQEINNNVVDSELGKPTTAKTFVLNPLNSAISRSLDEKLNGEFASIKDGGAIGDGTLHTLQEWVDSGKFSSLAAIKLGYPTASALTDSIDTVVIQTWIDKYKRVLAPAGVYVSNKSIVIEGSGCELYGESVSTYGAGETVKTRFVHAFNGDLITLNTTTATTPRGRHRIRGIAFASDDNFSGRAIALQSSQNHLVDLSFYKFKDGAIRIGGRSYGTYIITPSCDHCGSNGAYDIASDVDTGGSTSSDYNTITVVYRGIFETSKTGAISLKESDPFYISENYIEPFNSASTSPIIEIKNSLSGNTKGWIYKNYIGSLNGNGFAIHATGTNIKINDNIIADFVSGIYFSGQTASVVDNDISGYTNSGVQGSSVAANINNNFTVALNRLKAKSTGANNGIFLGNYINGGVVFGNLIRGRHSYGIRLYAALNTLVTNNNILPHVDGTLSGNGIDEFSASSGNVVYNNYVQATTKYNRYNWADSDRFAAITYDPPSLAAATQQSTTVTLTGAKLGNAVTVSFTNPLSGTRMWAEVTAVNTVTVYHRNDTGATVDLPSGTLTVKII